MWTKDDDESFLQAFKLVFHQIRDDQRQAGNFSPVRRIVGPRVARIKRQVSDAELRASSGEAEKDRADMVRFAVLELLAAKPRCLKGKGVFKRFQEKVAESPDHILDLICEAYEAFCPDTGSVIPFRLHLARRTGGSERV